MRRLASIASATSPRAYSTPEAAGDGGGPAEAPVNADGEDVVGVGLDDVVPPSLEERRQGRSRHTPCSTGCRGRQSTAGRWASRISALRAPDAIEVVGDELRGQTEVPRPHRSPIVLIRAVTEVAEAVGQAQQRGQSPTATSAWAWASSAGRRTSVFPVDSAMVTASLASRCRSAGSTSRVHHPLRLARQAARSAEGPGGSTARASSRSARPMESVKSSQTASSPP